MKREALVNLTGDIVSAHVANNSSEIDEVPALISSVYAALSGLGKVAEAESSIEPFTTIKKSVRSDHLVCLHCGGHFKMIKRHLRTEHGQTFDEYRETFGLPVDYPYASPEYSARRSKMAKKSGLGRKKGMRNPKRKKS